MDTLGQTRQRYFKFSCSISKCLILNLLLFYLKSIFQNFTYHKFLAESIKSTSATTGTYEYGVQVWAPIKVQEILTLSFSKWCTLACKSRFGGANQILLGNEITAWESLGAVVNNLTCVCILFATKKEHISGINITVHVSDLLFYVAMVSFMNLMNRESFHENSKVR